MMWSKGAVVVVKHGDPNFADAALDGMGFKTVPSREIEALQRDNFFLKRKAKKLDDKSIRKARRNYGRNPSPPPKWAQPLVDIWALSVYGVSTFVDRYLTIREG